MDRVHGLHSMLRHALILLFVMAISQSRADFMYPDFESTIGIAFYGDAVTTSCDDSTRAKYSAKHGTADISREEIPPTSEENTNAAVFQSTVTDEESVSARVAKDTAIIKHRDEYKDSPYDSCRIRLRLTPSEPSKRGAAWHARPLAVFKGFETEFKFQITGLSRSCTLVKDRAFSTRHHESCVVHGGDGFAFVLQGTPQRTYIVGGAGQEQGYGGIKNSIAVEFDTWYNPEDGDLFNDHISVQASRLGTPNSPGGTSRLSFQKSTPLADGKIHTVKIKYFPFLRYDFVQYFRGVEHLTEFMRDNEEARRIGTFVVYVDDMDTPLLAFPINLSFALDLREGTAWAGFTASTGRVWEKHDILSWYMCEDYKACGFNLQSTFDYHREHILDGKIVP